GEDMWWKLVRKYPNIHLVLSGHVVQGDGTGRRMDLGLNGNLVNQILSDYQSDPLGGGGYLRIMRISPSLNRVSVTTYSPYLDSFMTDDNSNFTIPPNARKSLAITAGKPGWLSDARTGTSTPNVVAEPSPTKIFISTAGQISGHVLNSGGAPVAGATLTFTGGKLRLSKTVTANGAGAFSSSWISVGSYTVTVAAPGFAGVSTTATVNTGLITALNITMK